MAWHTIRCQCWQVQARKKIEFQLFERYGVRSHSNPNYALQPGQRRESGQGARVPHRGQLHAVGLVLGVGELGKEISQG